MEAIHPSRNDALLVVDVQNDFLPGGALAVSAGDKVTPVLNRYIAAFEQASLPVYATRDWHPPDHCSFLPQGGIWPVHCVADTHGAAFPAGLLLPESTVVISKAMDTDRDAYSGFEGSDLAPRLQARGIQRVFIGGLTTDYCVLNSVKDALALGFQVVLLVDAIAAVNVQPGDGEAAMKEMIARGALPRRFSDLAFGDEPKPDPATTPLA